MLSSAERGAPETAESSDSDNCSAEHANEPQKGNCVAGEVVGGDRVHEESREEVVVYESTIRDLGGQVKGPWSPPKPS